MWHDRVKARRMMQTSNNPSHPLQIETATGLLPGERQVVSLHFDSRPAEVLADLIVIHGITLPPGEFGGGHMDRLFTGTLPADGHAFFATLQGLRVSAHALIERDGRISQYVPFHERAWHAGVSEYCGRSGCNDFSIGIELEGTDDTPYTDAQYQSLAVLIRALLAAYPSLSADRVVGHSDIAPGRKWDPGLLFDWPRFRSSMVSQGTTT